jgi:type IV pilus assembly protein PilF
MHTVLPCEQLCILLTGALALVMGCVSKGASGPGAQSPERQSDAEYDLSVEYFWKGDTRTALDHALKADALNDENAKALYFTSTIFLSFCSTLQEFAVPDCRLPEAEKYGRLAVAAASSTKTDDILRDAKNLLGQTLILEKKYAEAITVLKPLVDDPAYSASFLAWGNLGWAQVLSGSVDQGIQSLRNAVTQPRFCVGYYRLGFAYEKKGNLADAEANLTSAVQVDSPSCQNLQAAWEERGRVRAKMGKPEEARADFEKCKDISAESPAGRRCLNMLGGSGNPSAPGRAQDHSGGSAVVTPVVGQQTRPPAGGAVPPAPAESVQHMREAGP